MNNSNNLGLVLVLFGVVCVLMCIELELHYIATALETIAKHFSP